MPELGQALRKRRLELGLSQRKAAEEICSSALLSMIESGRAQPSARTMHKLAARYGWSLPELLKAAKGRDGDGLHFQLGLLYLEEGDWRSAQELFSKVEATAEREVGWYEWHMAQGRLLALAGCLEQALMAWEAVYERAAELQDAERMWQSVRLAGEAAEQQGRWDVAELYGRRAVRLLERGVPVATDQVIGLYLALSRAAGRKGRGEEAEQWAERALSARNQAADIRREAAWLREQARTALREGNPERAGWLIHSAREQWETAKRQKSSCEELRLYAGHLLRQGDVMSALDRYRQALDRIEGESDWPWLGQLLGEITACLYLTGRREEAEELWAERLGSLQLFLSKGQHQQHAGNPSPQ